MKNVLFLLLVTILPIKVVAQALEVAGYVIDDRESPIEFASVAVLNAVDSTFIGGYVTAEDGKFNVKVPTGMAHVIVRVSHISYENSVQTLKVGNAPVQIHLYAKALGVKEVSVSASRIVQHTMGYTANLASSPIVKGKNTSDALMFLPGITKERGVLHINGLPVSEVYVNGIKITSNDELNRLAADMIDAVKVDYIAGSNVNASTGGGVIHISLRKIADRNYYGSLSAEGIIHKGNGIDDESLNGTIYYRYKKLHIYDNLSLPWFQYLETGEQTFYDKQSNREARSSERNNVVGNNFANRLSLVQQLTPRSSLSLSYYISSNHSHSYKNTYAAGNHVEIDPYKRLLEQEVTTKYTTPVGKSKVMADLTIDYYHRDAKTTTDFLVNEEKRGGSEDKQYNDLWKGSLDFSQPVGKNVLSYGGAVQIVGQQFTPMMVNDVAGAFFASNMRTKVSGLTPYVYAQLMGSLKSLRYSLGLNWQMNRIVYSEDETATSSKNIQRGLSPSLVLMAPLNKRGSSTFRLVYKHVLDNIPYSAISSTIRWSDASNYSVGNPGLKAPTNDMLMISFSFLKNILSLTGIYMHSHNSIYWETVNSPESGNILYTHPINLAGIGVYGTGAELTLHPLKSWMLKANGRLELHMEDVSLDGVRYDKNRIRQYYTLYNSYTFASGWGGMLNMLVEPTFKNLDRVYHTVYNVTGKVYKTLLQDQVELGLSFALVGRERRYSRQTSLYTSTFNNTTAVPYIGMSIKWNFEKGKRSAVQKLIGNQGYTEIKDIR